MVRSTHQPINESLNRMYTGHTGNILSDKPNRIFSAARPHLLQSSNDKGVLLPLPPTAGFIFRNLSKTRGLRNSPSQPALEKLPSTPDEQWVSRWLPVINDVNINFAALNSRCSILKIKDLCEFWGKVSSSDGCFPMKCRSLAVH